jgi:RNA polymerase sigma-70 factor (ECF subfamily)
VNGQTGAILLTPDEQVICVFSFDIADGVVHSVRSVINPDKLRHVGPVADVRALLRRGSRLRDQ